MIDVNRFRKRLLDLQRQLEAAGERDLEEARDAVLDSAHDAGDASVSDVAAGDAFSEAELNSAILQQVQDALRRIENGTYGKCLADGTPIPEKRLEAVPWAAYCAKHQALLEAAGNERTWTL